MFTFISVAASLTRAMQDQDHGLHTRTPILLVTDIGSDPDDIMALLVLLASDKFQVDTNICKKNALETRPNSWAIQVHEIE